MEQWINHPKIVQVLKEISTDRDRAVLVPVQDR